MLELCYVAIQINCCNGINISKCILSREEENPRVSSFFFKVFIQSVLIFGAETWVVNPLAVQVLRGSNTSSVTNDGAAATAEAGRKEGRLEKRRVLSQRKPKFGAGIIQSRSILQCHRFWPCARRQREIRGHGWGCGGGKNRYLT